MYSFFSCFRRFIYVAFPQVGVLTIYERQSDNSLNAVQVRATIKHYEPALAHSARILMILQVTLSTNSILNFGHECCSAWTSALKFETLRLAHVALVMKIATIKLKPRTYAPSNCSGQNSIIDLRLTIAPHQVVVANFLNTIPLALSCQLDLA